LTSDVAEVAVGCGGKTKEGKWLSFMCFNLGADNTSTIYKQKNYPISISNLSDGRHTYISGEENLYGDLFQWGRIADGHEKRTSTYAPVSSVDASDIISGGICSSTSDAKKRPQNQIKSGTAGYGKFIAGGASDWDPNNSVAGWSVVNDPCTHYKDDGSYLEFWHAAGESSSDPTCTGVSAGWRTPTQTEWSELYRGGMFFGSPNDAEANTWVWNSTRGKGYEVRPDGETTTLFLSAVGIRYSNAGGPLYYQGDLAFYGSATATSNALYFFPGHVNPSSSSSHANGIALRCIKN
jgi:hypothetical protein